MKKSVISNAFHALCITSLAFNATAGNEIVNFLQLNKAYEAIAAKISQTALTELEAEMRTKLNKLYDSLKNQDTQVEKEIREFKKLNIFSLLSPSEAALKEWINKQLEIFKVDAGEWQRLVNNKEKYTLTDQKIINDVKQLLQMVSYRTLVLQNQASPSNPPQPPQAKAGPVPSDKIIPLPQELEQKLGGLRFDLEKRYELYLAQRSKIFKDLPMPPEANQKEWQVEQLKKFGIMSEEWQAILSNVGKYKEKHNKLIRTILSLLQNTGFLELQFIQSGIPPTSFGKADVGMQAK